MSGARRRTWRPLRPLVRSPLAAATMVLALALGIGVWITARVVRTNLGRTTLHARATPHRLERANAATTDRDLGARVLIDHPARALTYDEASGALAALPGLRRAATGLGDAVVAGIPGGPEPVRVRFASPELFDLFRLRLREGRGLDARTLLPPGRRPAVLDAALADRWWPGGARGRELVIAGRRFVVTGVLGSYEGARPHFDIPLPPTPEVYVPFDAFPEVRAQPVTGQAIGPLPGPEPLLSSWTFAHAWVEIAAPWDREDVLARLATAPGARGGWRLVPHPDWVRDTTPAPPGVDLFELFAWVTLLGCAAGLGRILGTRFDARRGEDALRRALGATRLDLLREHLLEAALVGLGGGLLGLGIGHGGLALFGELVRIGPGRFSLDAGSSLLSLGVALGAAVLAGLGPAWRATRVPPAAYLKGVR